MHPSHDSGRELTTCARSHLSKASLDAGSLNRKKKRTKGDDKPQKTKSGELVYETDGALVCVGDAAGGLRLAQWPCQDAGVSAGRTYRGHSGAVGKVRWTAGDTHVVSVGRAKGDRCLFAWKRVAAAAAPGGGAAAELEEALSGAAASAVAAADGDAAPKGLDLAQTAEEQAAAEKAADGLGYRPLPKGDGSGLRKGGDDDGADKAAEGFASTKPWLGAVVPPSEELPRDKTAPDRVQLELEHVLFGIALCPPSQVRETQSVWG